MSYEDMTREQLIAALSANSRENKILQHRLAELQKKPTKVPPEKPAFTTGQYLTDIIEHLPDATIVIERDKKVIAWNLAAEEMTGVTKEDMIGKGDYAYSVPFYGTPRPILIDLVLEDHAEIIKHYDIVEKKGATLFSEGFVPCLFEGKGAFLWGKASPLFDSDGALVGAIETVRDITERKIMEESHEAERQRLYSLLDRLPGFICLIKSDYSITFTNNNYRERFGETEGKRCYEVFNEMLAPCEVCPSQTVFKTGNSVEYEWTSPHGETYHIYDRPFYDVDGSLLVLELLIDITERKRIAEALSLSEARYRAIVEDQTELICRCSANGQLTFVNEKLCCFFKKKSEDLLGRSFIPLLFKDDRKKTGELIASLNLQNPILTDEHRILMPDGSIRWLQWSYRAVCNERGQTVEFQGVGRDITKRKIAEEDLETERKRLFNLLDRLPAQIALFAPNYEIRFANHTFYKQVCTSKGRYCYEAVWGLDKPCENCHIMKALETNMPVEWELTLRGRTYHYYDYPFFDFDGSRLVLKIGIDITDLKQAMEDLQLSEKRFAKAFNANPGVMAIMSLIDSSGDIRFIDVNTSFENVMGYHRDEVTGRTTSALGIWANPVDLEIIKGIILEQQGFRNIEIPFRIKSGEIMTGLVSAETIEFGGETCLIVNITDITERKQMAKEMARLERLNLVGEMAIGIGHEIRNPMTTVKGFLQILMTRNEYFKDRDYFELMVSELDRANSIITEFLSLARDKAVSLRPQNLNHIIQALSPLISADGMVSDQSIEFELWDIPDLNLDEKEIRQLILNLVRNGFEAMPTGGKLIIKTFQDSDEVILAVKDGGRGIAPEILEKIGTPFFTTKDTGTGLGLAVCYSIAARNNARIEIETGPEGTTFYARFKI